MRGLLRPCAALALAALLGVGVAAQTEAATTPPVFAPLPSEGLYPDVALSQDVVHAVAFLDRQGIMDGFPDGTFQPAGLVTRAQMAKIIAATVGLSPSTSRPTFTDAATIPTWAAPYVSAAAGAHLLSGYPDGTFRPGATISEAEVLAMLVRALGAAGYIKILDAEGETWPEDYVDAAAHFNLAGGAYPLTVTASAPATRGWTAEVVDNAIHGIADFTVTVAGRPVVSTEGGVWAANAWEGTLPATFVGTVAAVNPTSITLSVLQSMYPSGGHIPTEITDPLESNVLFDGGDMTLADVHTGDLVTLAVDSAGRVDAIDGPNGGGADACPPPFTATEATPGVVSMPIQLSGPAGTVPVLALAITTSPVSEFSSTLLDRLGYQAGKAFTVTFDNVPLTGSVYEVTVPQLWVGGFWYPLGQGQLTVAGYNPSPIFAGWQAVLGQDILRAFKISVQGGVWTLTPPCTQGQPSS